MSQLVTNMVQTCQRIATVEGEEWGAEYSLAANMSDTNPPEDCAKFRFKLWRIWDKTAPMCMVIGLNPSTADHLRNDPTVQLCCADAQYWGCGGLYMMNIWPYRATEPAQMKRYYQLFSTPSEFASSSHLNLIRIQEVAMRCDLVVAAWSGHADWLRKGEEVYNALSRQRELKCYRRLSNGEAGHPLYLKRPIKLQPYKR